MKIQQKTELLLNQNIRNHSNTDEQKEGIYRDHIAEKPTSPRTKMPVQTNQKPKFRDVRAREKNYKKPGAEAPVMCGILKRRKSQINNPPKMVGRTCA